MKNHVLRRIEPRCAGNASGARECRSRRSDRRPEIYPKRSSSQLDDLNLKSVQDEPSRQAAIDTLTCELSRSAIIELGDLIASLGRSAAEAAWRGSEGLCRLHLLECRETLKTAGDCLRRWEAAASNLRGGK